MREHLVVQRVLLVGQVDPREQRILVEQEVGDRRPAKHVELRKPAQLVDALEQERELRGQREARHVVVEAREKRIVVGLLEQLVGVQPLRELAREARLAGADRAFDDDVAAGGEVHFVVG